MIYIKKKKRKWIGAIIGIIGLLFILIFIPPWVWMVTIGLALAIIGIKMFLK